MSLSKFGGVPVDELTDFDEGDRVMTVDGFPGRVTAVNYGPYPGQETYQVELDGGMGGGDYSNGQLRAYRTSQSSLVEASEVYASIPVEAVTDHTANVDYPELEDILTKRLPNENIKIYAAMKRTPEGYTHASGWHIRPALNGNERQQGWHLFTPDDEWAQTFATKRDASDAIDRILTEHTGARNVNQMGTSEAEDDDPGNKIESDQGKIGDDPEDVAADSGEDTGSDSQVPEEEGQGQEEGSQEVKPGDVKPPDACSFCGASSFSDPQMTGRGVRMSCDQCGGTMTSWGGQWQPDAPNNPHNNASEQWDYRSGGPGGRGQAPANPLPSKGDPTQDINADKDDDGEDDDNTLKIKISSVVEDLNRQQIAESLQSQAGIVQFLFNRLYDKARKKFEQNTTEWWQPPEALVGTNLEGPGQYPAEKHASLGATSELDDHEWRWHFTSSWMDVQSKARKIRREGGVKIVAASTIYVAGEVKGDTAVYETQLNYMPGTKKVADWSCGCKWAAYTWGRSPQYKRFEGRLCSHALATQYEANSRGIFNREVTPDEKRPSWQKAHSPVVVQYDKDKDKNLTRRAVPPANMRRSFSSLILDSDGIYPEPRALDLQHAPLYVHVASAIDNGAPFESVIELVASFDLPVHEARALVFEALLGDSNFVGYPGYGEGPESGSDLLSEASTGMQREADFSTADPMAGMDGGNGLWTKTPHSNSENPVSSGFATSQDPQEWGRSLISNDFGVNFEAAYKQPLSFEAPERMGQCRSCGRPLINEEHEEGQCRECTTAQYAPDSAGGHAWHMMPGANHPIQVSGDEWADYAHNQEYHPEHFTTMSDLRREAVDPVNPQNPFEDPSYAPDEQNREGGNPLPAAGQLEEDLPEIAATLHEGPEAALPFTDGEAPETSAEDSVGNSSEGLAGERLFDKASSYEEFVQAFHHTAGGQKLMKEAAKDFNFAEQQALIQEGEGVRARNLGDLQIEGTHYALIDQIDDLGEDEKILWV